MSTLNKELSPRQIEGLIDALKSRFEKHPDRHKGMKWPEVMTRLESQPEKLWSLGEMERTGGEPDVVGMNPETGEVVFMDCSAESPSGRRNLCFDHQAWESRKKFRPESNALDVAADMGIELLTEDQYRYLQMLGKFDQKTSSWVQTPPEIRKLGGALFCDRRYDTVFLYHNGADSYYGVRGFRGVLRV